MKLVKEISQNQREWRNDPSVYATCRQYDLISKEKQRNWLERIETDPTIEMFGIDVGENNIGTCGLTSISYIHGTAEYSLLIAPDAQGHGYAEKALRLLLDEAFKRLRLNVVWGEIFKNNPKALHIAKKIGFREVGRKRERYFKDGEYIDTTEVEILRREYLC